MKDFYESFYAAVETSQAHHAFCERVFGRDLCQHGFTDQRQFNLLLRVTQLDSTKHVLDLGCGNGRIAFLVGDINQLELPPHAFEIVVSIGSIYFSNN